MEALVRLHKTCFDNKNLILAAVKLQHRSPGIHSQKIREIYNTILLKFY